MKIMDNWEYETKCRRCGRFTKWHFSTKKSIDWMVFAQAMTDNILNPRQYECKKCKNKTVQDVTRYNEPFDEKF